MAVVEQKRRVGIPEQGNLVRVRDRFWIVESVVPSRPLPGSTNGSGSATHHAVRLVPVDDRGGPDPLTVFWELEPGTEIRPQASLPDPADGLDDSETFSAFLDAARWGAVAAADPTAFQSPFRAGIDIKDYQLLPLVKALSMPRVSLLIADDVGLGKTIEAGLIAEELVLRGQARKIMVVCPPSLCGKWQREMRDKFGLAFEVVNREHLSKLRRERGVGANPFRSHPRLIVSLEWLKLEPQLRRFDEFLPPDPNTYPRAFDLLIVDEAHLIAPAAGGNYAQPSLRTAAVRKLAPHFEHRLFLTATPHNGYRNSFESLMETLDPNRFATGVPVSDRDRDAVMVRRLKSHLRQLLPDNEATFPIRRIQAIEVAFGDAEREMFHLLDEYTAARRSNASTPVEQAAARFITLLLKKRLLSSPAAFKHTIDRHLETLDWASQQAASVESVEQAASVLVAEVDDDDTLDEMEQEALAVAATALPEKGIRDQELLARLRARTLPYDSPRQILDELKQHADRNWRRPDSKTQTLIDWIAATCFPDGGWNNERVIVFTEYRATLNYLHEMLTSPHPGRPSMRDRVEVFHGGTDPEERDRIIREFNYDPNVTKVRVLLATDAASEGIDLHGACHRLVHVEVPFNPNRMEQRNGRVDRHGQKSPHVDILHFTSPADEDDSIGYDHAFLLRVAQKVDEIRDDLGTVSSVLAERIEARMLRSGDNSLDLDAVLAARRDNALVDLAKLKRDFTEQLGQVRQRYSDSVAELELSPESVERAVRIGLAISNQPEPIPQVLDTPGGPTTVFEIPDLSGTWPETLVGLYDEVADQRLLVTFDAEIASGRRDIAYLHLGHPLVARCLRTLRSQVWGVAVDRSINRAAIRYADVDEAVAVAHTRIVVNGADGSILDEVIEPAAVRVSGRQGRLNVGETQAVLAARRGDTPPPGVSDKYVDQWQRVRPALEQALAARAEEVRDQRERRLDAKRDREAARLQGTLTDLKTSIQKRLDELESSSDAEQLRLFDAEEREQFEADIAALRRRIHQIDGDMATEVKNLEARYKVRDIHWFPVAVEIVVPLGVM
ncbi:DISARM system SNF2-like helicase DrmD [Candidatus Poriferisocius sp.]|uniref:DISARM system SNF2-like helicase DrmD n=1 Tax=Candidatus Poriferisocius sp. TaxID=3101276 RepID=UPI003B52FC4A